MKNLVDRIQGSYNNSQDLLQGIGGPMTRSRANKSKQALQGLIMEIQDKAINDDSCASPLLINVLCVRDDEHMKICF